MLKKLCDTIEGLQLLYNTLGTNGLGRNIHRVSKKVAHYI